MSDESTSATWSTLRVRVRVRVKVRVRVRVTGRDHTGVAG